MWQSITWRITVLILYLNYRRKSPCLHRHTTCTWWRQAIYQVWEAAPLSDKHGLVFRRCIPSVISYEIRLIRCFTDSITIILPTAAEERNAFQPLTISARGTFLALHKVKHGTQNAMIVQGAASFSGEMLLNRLKSTKKCLLFFWTAEIHLHGVVTTLSWQRIVCGYNRFLTCLVTGRLTKQLAYVHVYVFRTCNMAVKRLYPKYKWMVHVFLNKYTHGNFVITSNFSESHWRRGRRPFIRRMPVYDWSV